MVHIYEDLFSTFLIFTDIFFILDSEFSISETSETKSKMTHGYCNELRRVCSYF